MELGSTGAADLGATAGNLHATGRLRHVAAPPVIGTTTVSPPNGFLGRSCAQRGRRANECRPFDPKDPGRLAIASATPSGTHFSQRIAFWRERSPNDGLGIVGQAPYKWLTKVIARFTGQGSPGGLQSRGLVHFSGDRPEVMDWTLPENMYLTPFGSDFAVHQPRSPCPCG